jgi:hypothetical protein
MVVLGWITNKPLTLLMDPFESLVLYLSGKLPLHHQIGVGELINIPCSTNDKLCPSGRKVQLAGGRHPHLWVSLMSFGHKY